MRKAFTLLELLVVMGIMGALAAMSVSSYRALTRGMEDRSAVVAAQSFLDLAVQRAEIDHTPVVIYLYDELLQKESSDGTEEQSGRGIAYAIRPSGRVTGLSTDEGDDLILDEFSDLDQIYVSEESMEDDSKAQSSNAVRTKFYLLNGNGEYFEAAPMVVTRNMTEAYVVTGQQSAESSSGGGTKSIRVPAFRMLGGKKPSVGDVYGTEFAVRTLPNGYFFGQSPPTSVGRSQNPVTTIKITASGEGSTSIPVYRYKSGSSTTESVGTATRRK
ncbi:MAG: type II secretion system protein [Kiritimatiellae bacterium]|nr:type II secretion system protein [Kiritimatiellia bacterium]